MKKPLTNWEDKKNIISLLYDKFNLHAFRYTIVKKSSHVDFLQKNKHYILLNYASKSYLLVFFMINKVKVCALIDRKSLVYQPKNLDDVIRGAFITCIEPSQVLKNDLYKGTILDVKLVNNLFFVYNVFMWKGEDKTSEPTLESFNQLNNEKIEMIIPTTYYNYSDLHQLKQVLVEDSRVTGLIFIPKIPGNQMVFLKESKSTVQQQQVVQDDNKFEVFTMTCHEFPDVYILKNDKMTKVAYIPSIELSKKCLMWIKDKKSIKVKCKYNDVLDKYIPYELA